jgi:hypothetical protein
MPAGRGFLLNSRSSCSSLIGVVGRDVVQLMSGALGMATCAVTCLQWRAFLNNRSSCSSLVGVVGRDVVS